MKMNLSTIIDDLPLASATRKHDITVVDVLGDANTLVLKVGSHGDLSLFVTIGEEQIVVSAPIVPVAQIPEQADFNVVLLKSQGTLPLSSFAIQSLGGEDWYEVHGEMSLESSFSNLLEELVTTADNAIRAGELVEEWKTQKAGS